MNLVNQTKVCFVTGAVQENYINQLNTKLSKLVSDFKFPYYVYSDQPDKIDSSYENLKIYDFTELTKRTPGTVPYEVVSGTTKLSEFPQNSRRHIINQAFTDGYEYVIWNDVDVDLVKPTETLLDVLSKLKINNIYTQFSIYRNDPEREGNKRPFILCKEGLVDLGISANIDDLLIHDGPLAIYYFDEETKRQYIKTWDAATEYAYNHGIDRGGHNRPGVEVYAIAQTGVGVEHIIKHPFTVKHDRSVHYR